MLWKSLYSACFVLLSSHVSAEGLLELEYVGHSLKFSSPETIVHFTPSWYRLLSSTEFNKISAIQNQLNCKKTIHIYIKSYTKSKTSFRFMCRLNKAVMTGLFFQQKKKKHCHFFSLVQLQVILVFYPTWPVCMIWQSWSYNFLPLQEIEKVVGPGGMEFIWISLLSLLLTFLLH